MKNLYRSIAELHTYSHVFDQELAQVFPSSAAATATNTASTEVNPGNLATKEGDDLMTIENETTGNKDDVDQPTTSNTINIDVTQCVQV